MGKNNVSKVQAKGYKLGKIKARFLLKELVDDFKKGYFKKFSNTDEVLQKCSLKINTFVNTDNKLEHILLDIEELNTLRANDYLKGNPTEWYYPRLNENNVITLN